MERYSVCASNKKNLKMAGNSVSLFDREPVAYTGRCRSHIPAFLGIPLSLFPLYKKQIPLRSNHVSHWMELPRLTAPPQTNLIILHRWQNLRSIFYLGRLTFHYLHKPFVVHTKKDESWSDFIQSTWRYVHRRMCA
jgi:hypothetical protein